jgi:hypothetical protein
MPVRSLVGVIPLGERLQMTLEQIESLVLLHAIQRRNSARILKWPFSFHRGNVRNTRDVV